jgi:hypothetical protein
VKDGLLRIDAGTNQSFGIVSLGGYSAAGIGNGLAAAGDTVWAATVVGGEVRAFRVDARTGTVTKSVWLDLPGYVDAGAVDLEFGDGALWAAIGVGDQRHLLRFDPSTLANTRHLVVPIAGPGADVAADDLAITARRALVTDQGPGGLTVVDTATHPLADQGDLPARRTVADGRQGPSVLDQHRVPTRRLVVDGRQAWVVSAGELLGIDPASGRLTRRIVVPPGIEDLAPVGNGTYWASDPAEGRLVKLRVP